MKYKIQTELKTPWIGKPYVEYQLVKVIKDYEPYNLRPFEISRVIFKSRDKTLVEKFLNQLQEV